METLLYQIALTQIPSVGSVTAKTLISYCGSAQAVFKARKKELMRIPGIGEHTANHILKQDVLSLAESELQFIEQYNIRALCYLDSDYPSRLKPFPDCPVMLYCKGPADLNATRSIAIVGTRRPTPYGLSWCEELVEGLAAYQPLVVSGLALGVDAAAHRKCLEMGIGTIGVLGHGLRQIYPPQHRRMAERMIETGGLLTEHLSIAQPDKDHFPMRNRIIAGLCDALVVVETEKKGGSMITVQFADNYHKDVFAVPGRARDRMSAGCNHLIKTHRAALMDSVSDLAYVLRWDQAPLSGLLQAELFVELTEDEKIIVDLLTRYDMLSIDQLIYECQMPVSAMASLMVELECKGLVKTLPGKRYMRT